MQIHLYIIGILLIGLSLIHVIFPKYFQWKQQLQSLSVINRQMMYVHSFFIAFVVFLIGLLCLTSSDALINTSLGKRISLGLAVFWIIRLLVQFFGYSAETWRGSLFRTTIHILFSIFWTYLSVVFMMAYLE